MCVNMIDAPWSLLQVYKYVQVYMCESCMCVCARARVLHAFACGCVCKLRDKNIRNLNYKCKQTILK